MLTGNRVSTTISNCTQIGILLHPVFGEEGSGRRFEHEYTDRQSWSGILVWRYCNWPEPNHELSRQDARN
jgi:hypothetical protein